MRKIILFIVIAVNIQACAQKKENMTFKHREIFENLKKFDSEPIYQVEVKSRLPYTILINDIPVLNQFDPDALYAGNNINNCIPESGKQELKIVLYPSINTKGEFEEFIGDEHDFSLQIKQSAWEDGSMTEPKVILDYELPRKKYGDEIDYSQLSVFEDTMDFKAKVPYKLIDWREGKVFNLKDSVILKEKVLAYYNKLKYYFENQQGEAYVDELEKGLFNIAQASYATKNFAENFRNKKIALIDKKKRELAPIENYTMQILGNGTLISLRRTDGYNKNEGVVRQYYKRIVEKVQIDDVILYVPKDSEDYEFVPIWYIGIIKAANP